MKRFVEGGDRRQATLLPDSLEDYVTEDNPVRVVDVFIDELDLEALGFSGVAPEVTGRPAYHPATLLKITFTAISIASSRAGGSNGRPNATSS
jgi:transposase